MINKRGSFGDLFIFMIFAFIIALVCGVFFYIGITTKDQLHDTMDDMDFDDGSGNNASEIIENTFGGVTTSYNALSWLSIILIFGMIVSIFIGSYLVTTKPIFFIPYFFISIIAIIVAVPMANAYEDLIANPTLASSFSNFLGMNFVILNLPVFITIIAGIGAIIMFSRMGKREEQVYYG